MRAVDQFVPAPRSTILYIQPALLHRAPVRPIKMRYEGGRLCRASPLVKTFACSASAAL
jgi:hypothetical protein